MSSKCDHKDDAKVLVEKIRKWLQLQKEAAKKLNKLASEVENNNKNVNISKVVGSSVGTVGALSLIGATVLTFFTGGLAAPLLITGIGATAAGLATNVASDIADFILSSGTTKETKEISDNAEKLEKEIKDLIQSLEKEEEKEQPTGSSTGVPHEDYVLDHILKAIAKSHKLDLDHVTSLYQAFFTLLSFEIKFLSRLIVKKAVKYIVRTLISGVASLGAQTVAKTCGKIGGNVVGLGFSIYDLVESSMNVNNPETEVTKNLRENAAAICSRAEELENELREIDKVFEMLAEVKRWIQNTKRSSDDKKTLIEYVIENCKDKDAVEWLKKNSQCEALAQIIEQSRLI
ncbi:hypothetical protein EXN66_Car016311 [Channa argus]|uniref:Apolipoprotein L3 n=1 Tax=Channa argus TaxID=215402 RepID=A0A6G1QDX4_CHAAH|nr:hypothetical protein EXN66_Car016311 [Channa argus]